MATIAAERGRRVALDRIRVPENVRVLDDAHVQALAGSIALQGMLVPVVVHDAGDGFELVAGVHRIAAARSLGLAEVPVVVRNAETEDADRAVENITSCRRRHDTTYADHVVMPMSELECPTVRHEPVGAAGIRTRTDPGSQHPAADVAEVVPAARLRKASAPSAVSGTRAFSAAGAPQPDTRRSHSGDSGRVAPCFPHKAGRLAAASRRSIGEECRSRAIVRGGFRVSSTARAIPATEPASARPGKQAPRPAFGDIHDLWLGGGRDLLRWRRGSRASLKFCFGDDGSDLLACEPCASASGEQGPRRGRCGGEGEKSQRRWYVGVDRLDAAAQEVGLVPEAGAGGVAQERAPPLFVRERAGPALEGVEVAPSTGACLRAAGPASTTAFRAGAARRAWRRRRARSLSRASAGFASRAAFGRACRRRSRPGPVGR
jgi:hypothetical protein